MTRCRVPTPAPSRARAGAAGEDGSAVAEFVLVTALLLVLFGLVLQVGLLLHARTLLVAAAAEGARHAANADRSHGEGVERTRQAIAEGLGTRVLSRMSVSAGTTSADGAAVVEVTVTGAVPLRFLPAGPVQLTVRGHALEEG